jgi:hypothetical protein
VPEGLFDASGGFHPLPPPDDEEVQATLLAFLRKLGPLLLRQGLDELEAFPEDALDGLRLCAAQARLPLGLAPTRAKRRCAQLEGFSLHANTHVHENDRRGLEQLCRYGARGPLALERLTEHEDGRLAYRLKRPAPDGSTHLLLTQLELLRRLVALLPPPRFHLTRFHGVFAPNSRLRARVVAQAQAKPDTTPAPAPRKAKTKRKTRIPWAELLKRSFGVDVLNCHACGAPRRVMAYVSRVSEARRFLRHLGVPEQPAPLAAPRATGPPQLRFEPELAAP